MDLPTRKQNRLREWDYSSEGIYFLTICTKDKKKLLCEIVGGGALDAPQVKLSSIGKIVETHIVSSDRIPGVMVDKYVIMPNHIHLLIRLNGTSRAPSPTNGAVPRLVGVFKRLVNKEVGKNIFQRSYHDHIIRNEADYRRICEYIDTNPAKWEEDCFYVE